MINIKKISLILCIILVTSIAFATPAMAAGSQSRPADKLVIGETFILASGETYTGDLFVLGGTVRLDAGSNLNGDILLLGATLDVDGTLSGDIIALGGNVSVNAGAVVEGDVNSAGAFLDIDPNARVEGSVNTETSGSFWVEMPRGVRIPSLDVTFNPFLEMVWFAFRTLLWALLAMLVVMFLARPTSRVAQAIVREPLISGGVGLLTVVVLPVILIVLSITIILIPLTFSAFIALVIAWGFGVVALGLELGKRISKVFNQEWHPALASGVGTFVLILVVNGLDALIPCIGWIPQFILGVFGLGGVLVTYFGSRNFPIKQEIQRTDQSPTVDTQAPSIED